MLKIDGKYGDVYLTDIVIAKLVGSVATSCFGVVGMATRNATDSFTSLLKWENMEKGVEIQYSDNTLKIGLHIIMTYGVNIPAISDSIKSKVVYSVGEFTGIKVGEVKIFVDSLKM